MANTWTSLNEIEVVEVVVGAIVEVVVSVAVEGGPVEDVVDEVAVEEVVEVVVGAIVEVVVSVWGSLGIRHNAMLTDMYVGQFYSLQ